MASNQYQTVINVIDFDQKVSWLFLGDWWLAGKFQTKGCFKPVSEH